MVEFFVVESVPSTLGMGHLGPVIIEITITHGALVRSVRKLGVVGYRHNELLPCDPEVKGQSSEVNT